MSLNVYLFFDGNCKEAFEFYRSVFGGEFALIMTFADGPPDMKVPEAEKDRIMHVSLPVGSTVLMGSDSASAFGPPPVAGDNFAISVVAESREQCDDLCARLSEGGTVTTPPQEMFWGAYFGCWTDRFGLIFNSLGSDFVIGGGRNRRIPRLLARPGGRIAKYVVPRIGRKMR